MSIHAALEAALGPESIAPQRFDTSIFCNFDRFDLLHPQARSQVAVSSTDVRSLGSYAAVSGHFSLPTLVEIAPPSAIATVLREPRARLLSLYLYWRTPAIGNFWTPYQVDRHAGRPLAEFLSERRLAPAVDNQICRLLLHGDPRLPVDGFAAESDLDGISADAIERLDTLGFVGVLEKGEKAWGGVGKLFGVELDPMRLNVTGETINPTAVHDGQELVTAAAADLLEERNAADMVVYEHALVRAGLGERERSQLTDHALARQLVKAGDLVGRSAARVAELTRDVGLLRSELREEKTLVKWLDDAYAEFAVQERKIEALEEKIRCQRNEAEKLRGWLTATHSSASWRLTMPLRAAKSRVQYMRSSTRR